VTPNFRFLRYNSRATVPQFALCGAVTVPKCLCEKARSTLAKLSSLHSFARTAVEPKIYF
jgi:hypothetical protein